MDACILCKSSKKDDVQYGEYLKNERLGVHTFCLYLSSNLSQNGEDDEGFLGFLEADIKQEVQRISLLKCCYCRKNYANIGCCEKRCRRCFHFICGLEHKAENHFCNDYRSFCHSHVRSVKQHPATNETCLICYESLCGPQDKFNPVNMILSPCCRNGWFHKLCLQKFAKTAGYFFKCPLCNDSSVFRNKLPAKGIFIPDRDAAWELEPNAFADLLERPNECSAIQCTNRKGRKANCKLNPFVICSTCGSTAMHRHCLPNGDESFHCADCTIAWEEDDSGRESLNTHGIHDSNDNEDIDVCHVSDKENFDIVNAPMAAQTRGPQTKRDSGAHHLDNESSDEEIKSITTTYNARRLRIDSDNSDVPQVSKQKKCFGKYFRIRSDTECSGDNSEQEEIKSTYKPSFRRLKTDSESSDIKESKETPQENSSTLSDEEIVATSRKRMSTIVLSDSEDEPFAKNAIKPKRLNNKFSRHEETMEHDCHNLSISSESSDDDRLENFRKNIETRNNISCIALRTRRSLNLNKLVENNEPLMQPHTTNQKENVKNQANVKTRKRQSLKKPATKDSINEGRNSNSNETKFDISCIAKRTRRKSMGCWRNNKTATQTLSEGKENSLNVSCIAVRTRRKTICAKTTYSEESLFERSAAYEKIHESDEDYEYEQTDSEFEISCIAKRTRRRTSMSTQLQNIAEEINDSNDSCSTSNTGSSSSFRSSLDLGLANVNLRKRCQRRISSNSSEDLESCQPTSTRQLLKTKSLNGNLLLEKFPQRNYTAYLKPKYTAKTSCSNELQNYHLPNHYNPHNSNRNRF